MTSSSPKIFISSRRQDSRSSVNALFGALCTALDRQQIFMDIDTISPGEDFVAAIENEVSKCDVLIAVIGARWLTSTDAGGRRLLDNPVDFVRMEVAAALKSSIPVIPVLVDGALMPKPSARRP
jgi:hypothetical protein